MQANTSSSFTTLFFSMADAVGTIPAGQIMIGGLRRFKPPFIFQLQSVV
jgi:hypothetical protein